MARDCCWWLAGCVLVAGCAWGRPPRANVPVSTDSRVVRSPFVIDADFPFDERLPLLDELQTIRDRVGTTLELPQAESPIEIHLYSSSERFYATVAERFPNFPARRAFFVKHWGRFEVYAQWSDRAAEDLRHEVTHACLHAAGAELPLWLDEGLAEYFETPAASDGWNAPHAELLLADLQTGRWRPDLRRLEMLSSSADMTQRDYAEAWAWAYLALRTLPPRRDLVLAVVQASVRHEPAFSVADAFQRGEPAPQSALVAVLEQTRHERLAETAP